LSLGDRRKFELTTGGSSHIEVLPDGDLFVLGPETNASMKHAVLPVNRESVVRRVRQSRPRISIVLRQITTEVTIDQLDKRVQRSLADKDKRDAKKVV
jgi:hypothetical protein